LRLGGLARRIFTHAVIVSSSWQRALSVYCQKGIAMTRMVNCIKLGREAEGLDVPPMPGELGKKLYDSVSKEAWQAWLKLQTMLINENRLNLADPRARQYLTQQMQNHFFGSGSEMPTGYVPPQA
jgi:Fe-S cluster biosynthesis and repair protein YggX